MDWFLYDRDLLHERVTAWKVSKYGVISGPYFPTFGLNTDQKLLRLSVFSPNVGKYGPEMTPYLDTLRSELRKEFCNEEAFQRLHLTLLWRRPLSEYNFEFQGSVRNLQKRALFMKFYPTMPWNNTTFGKKGTFC